MTATLPILLPLFLFLLYAPNSLLQRVFGCFFLFVFLCVCLFFARGVGCYSMWFLCSIYPRTMNTFWLFGPKGSHAYILWSTVPESWVSSLCVWLPMHAFTQTAYSVFWLMSSFCLMSLSLFSFWPLCVFGCLFLFMRVRDTGVGERIPCL